MGLYTRGYIREGAIYEFFPDGGLYPKHRGIIFSVFRNAVISFADATATIWNIVYDRNTTKESVKLHEQNIF